MLPRQEIIRRIEKEKLIDNADVNKSIGPASYELRAGTYLHNNEVHPLADGDAIAIAPNSFVLLGTFEKLNLPLDLAGLLFLKSSFGRQGILPWSQGFVDPEFKGNITIAIQNMTPNLLPISALQPVCHIVFFELTAATDAGYIGPYNNSTGPTASKQKSVMKIVGQSLASFGRQAAAGIAQGATEELGRMIVGSSN